MTDTDVRRIEDKVDNVHLILAELKGSLSPTLEKLTDAQKNADDELKDHEKRIRSLERFRYAWPSLALIGVLISAGLLVFYLTHGG